MIDLRIPAAAILLMGATACEETQSLDVSNSPSIVAEDEAQAGNPETVAAVPLFRGVGQEPGWLVRIYPETIVYEADYGQRTVTVRTPEPEETDDGRSYVTSQISVEIVDQECSDTMSGARYSAQVTITEGERSLQGCGGDELSGPDDGV